MQGYIRLYRKIRENPIFNDLELFRLWLICLTEATHKERDQLVGRQTVHLMPGEFVTGRFDLQEMFNKGLKRDQQKSPKTVWRWLETLENGEYLTIKSTNKFSVVAVLNWQLYQYGDQENDQQVTNKRPTDDQQVTTNKNVKKDKNDKKVKEINYTVEFEEFWRMYPRRLGKVDSLKSWDRALKAGHSPILITLCAENYAKECQIKQTEERFIKHPTTFLNNERFKDYESLNITSISRQQTKSGKHAMSVVEDRGPAKTITPEEREKMRELALKLKKQA